MHPITPFALCLLEASVALASPAIGTRCDAPSIKWSKCLPDPVTGPADKLDCGEVTVPMNHSDPDGPTIKLGFTRLNATGSNSKGSLFLQSGGPGGWTSLVPRDQLHYEETGNILYQFVSSDLRAAYDIIGLDMRGEGISQPFYCDPDIYNRPHQYIPADEEAFKQLWDRNRAFAESCYDMTGPFFNLLGTDQVIQDVDLVRQALGDPKLNFFGYSYGTEVGAMYAARYPDKIGKIVIDGNLDHSMTVPQSFIELAVALENSVEFFFQWCNATSDCALHGQDQGAIWDGIITHADDGTLVDEPCKELKTCKVQFTAEDFIATAQNLMETGNVQKNIPGAPSDYFVLAESLDAARDGNATAFRTNYIVGNSSADLSTNSVYSFQAIFCADWEHSIRTFDDMKALATVANVLAPRTRGVGTMALGHSGCVGWPFPPSNPQHKLDFSGHEDIPPIMIAGSFHDEATSLQWSVAHRWMIPNSFNVWRNGGGHTDYHFMGGTQKAIDAFLINGTIPQDGTIYQD